MQKLFKNANLVDFDCQNSNLVDILVSDGKIVQIGKNLVGIFDEIVDLEQNFVIPLFVNCYCDSFSAFQNDFGCFDFKDPYLKKNISDLMFVKNLLAGCVVVNDLSTNNSFNCQKLEKLNQFDDEKLSLLSNLIAKNKNTLFLKVGQDLQELGFVDKNFGTTLSQLLEDFGLLDRKCVLVGGNCLEKDELQLLRNYDAKFVVAPNEDGVMGRRSVNLKTLLNLDYDIGVGSGDCFQIDFFAFARQILISQKTMFENKDVMTEKQVLKFATNGSVLGIDNKIKLQNFASFAVVEKGIGLYDNPLKSLVYEKSKKDVVMTVFKGEILQKNGKIFMKNISNYDTIIEEIRSRVKENKK